MKTKDIEDRIMLAILALDKMKHEKNFIESLTNLYHKNYLVGTPLSLELTAKGKERAEELMNE